jgi:arginyl-tRNA synthetase
VADAIVERHLATMLRLGVEYDVLPRESEILHLQFWASAFELLKQRQAIYLENRRQERGCWVMPAEAFAGDSGSEDSKVIVRSDGTVTYVGKDIAYQLWKFGCWARISTIARSCATRMAASCGSPPMSPRRMPPRRPSFGHGTRVYNVIDVGNRICRTWWWRG